MANKEYLRNRAKELNRLILKLDNDRNDDNNKKSIQDIVNAADEISNRTLNSVTKKKDLQEFVKGLELIAKDAKEENARSRYSKKTKTISFSLNIEETKELEKANIENVNRMLKDYLLNYIKKINNEKE